MRQGNFVRVERSMRCKMSIFGWIAKKSTQFGSNCLFRLILLHLYLSLSLYMELVSCLCALSPHLGLFLSHPLSPSRSLPIYLSISLFISSPHLSCYPALPSSHFLLLPSVTLSAILCPFFLPLASSSYASYQTNLNNVNIYKAAHVILSHVYYVYSV